MTRSAAGNRPSPEQAERPLRVSRPSVATSLPHNLHGFCWCQPLVETDAVTGGHLFIHRRAIDSPHIEPAP